MMGFFRWTVSNRVLFPAYFALYGIIAYLFSVFANTGVLLEWINSIHICVGLAVLVVYWPIIRDVFVNDVKMGPIQHLGMGIIFTWLSTVISRAYTILFRTTGDPSLLHQYVILGLMSWIGILGGLMHLTAPKKIKSISLESYGMLTMLYSFSAGSALTILVFLLKPELYRWLEHGG